MGPPFASGRSSTIAKPRYKDQWIAIRARTAEEEMALGVGQVCGMHIARCILGTHDPNYDT